jgi:opacity protein-like surface antigen
MRRGVNDHCKGVFVNKKCAVFLVVMVCALGLMSQASAARLGNYVALKGGIYSPSASFTLKNLPNSDSFDANTKAGFAGEIAFGRYVLPTLALELGAGYFKGKGTFTPKPLYDLDFNVIPVIVSAKALIPVGPVDPYGEAGIGAYFTKAKVIQNQDTFNFSGTTTFGFHAGVGLNVNVSQNAFLGVEGKYVTASPSIGDQKIKLNSTDYALNGFKLNGFITTVVLGFSF